MFAMLGVFSNFPCRGIFEKEDEEVGWRMANIENAEKVSRIGNGTIHFPTFKRYLFVHLVVGIFFSQQILIKGQSKAD